MTVEYSDSRTLCSKKYLQPLVLGLTVSLMVFIGYFTATVNMGLAYKTVPVDKHDVRVAPFNPLETHPSPACFSMGTAQPSIGLLRNILQDWSQSKRTICRQLYRRFHRLFDVRSRTGGLRWNSSFQRKMTKWLGNDLRAVSEARRQTVIFTRNKWTSEGSIFNPIRQKRPKSKGGALTERQFIERLSNETRRHCDFCNYTSSTAFDTFGRIESTYSFTVANAFKLDAWHALVVFRNHHPLTWTMTELKDVFHVAQRWYARVHSSHPWFVYPMVSWDLLPHSGSSQVHPHIHTYLTPDGYYGDLRQWQKASEEYGQKTGGANYYTDFVSAHRTLGLSVSHGSAVALTSLTPRKDNEIIILSKEFDENFIELIYYVLRTYIDSIGRYSFSMVIALPPMVNNVTGTPALARVVTRAASQDTRSDITSMELFAASNIDTDLFKFARVLQNSTNAFKTTGKVNAQSQLSSKGDTSQTFKSSDHHLPERKRSS